MLNLFVAFWATLLLLSVACLCVPCPALDENAQPVQQGTSSLNFSQYTTVSSQGGHATCIQGPVNVTASANNTKLLYTPSANQYVMTETYVQLLETYPTIYTTTNGGSAPVSGTWSIYSRLCFPSNPSAAAAVKTVQLLTHGALLDVTYFDFAPGYSYVDAAAAAGYATFSYDRLGVGNSEHPDPIQVVQAALEIEILHQIAQGLRSASIQGHSFKNIVGVAHSAGSAFTAATSAKYPHDFDAVMLTGLSTSTASVNAAQAAQDLIIANTSPSGRFKGLANDYYTTGTQQGLQFAFFSYPDFDPNILAQQFLKIQTNSLGELLTLASTVEPAVAFTNAALVLNGNNDNVFCGGNCMLPSNQAETALAFFYPTSRSTKAVLIENAGHNVFQHLNAAEAFNNMTSFLQVNGL